MFLSKARCYFKPPLFLKESQKKYRSLVNILTPNFLGLQKSEVLLENTNSGMRLFFHLYHTNHHPGRWEPRNLHGSKMGLEQQKSEISLGTKMDVE